MYFQLFSSDLKILTVNIIFQFLDTKSVPQQGIQLVVEFPDAVRKKQPKKIDVEMMMKRKINRVKKEYQVYMHKVHVLSWIGHGNYISNVLNDRVLMAAALSLIPSKERRPKNKIDINYLEEITKCYKDHVTLKHDKNEDKFKPKSPPLKQILLHLIETKVLTSKKYLVFIFVIILRALGLQCRIMFNFVTLPIRPLATELCSLSTKQKDKKTSNKQNSTQDKTSLSETNSNISPEKEDKMKSNRKARTRKNIPQIDGNYDISSDYEDSESDYEDIMQVDGGDDGLTTRRTRSNKRNISDVVDNIKDENMSPPKKSRKNPAHTTLQQKVSCDENKNVEGNKKAKRGRNAVGIDKTFKNSDNMRNKSTNLKELTNITSTDLTEEKLPSTKVTRKGMRSTTQQTLTKDNQKQVTAVSKMNQGNLKTLTVKVKLNPIENDLADNSYEVIEESVSSLKVTRRSPRQNSPIHVADNDKNDVAPSKRNQRRGKTVDPGDALSTGDNSQRSNRKEADEMISETSKEDLSPKIPKNSHAAHAKNDDNKNKLRNRTIDDFKSPPRKLTRRQKSQLPTNEQRNYTTTKEKATSVDKKSMNQKKNIIAASDKPGILKIPSVVLTRHNVNNNEEKANPTEIQGRVTRKRLQTANSTKGGTKGVNTLKKGNVKESKSITKKRAAVTQNNISAKDETSQNSSKMSIKEESTESRQTVRDKKPTRNNKPEKTENPKTKENITKTPTRKKSLKGMMSK